MPQRFAAAGGQGPKRRRILAYGDSLTAGYWDGGDRFAPYGRELVESLQAGAGEIAAEVWVCGLSSLTGMQMARCVDKDRVRDGVGRVGKGLNRILEEQGPFDLALIMVGTNDLGKTDDLDPIMDGVRKLHAACHKRGVPTVALSVPPNKFSRADEESEPEEGSYEADWQALNKRIQEWASKEKGVVLHVDVNGLVPYTRETDCWEGDGLHFSPKGSQSLGRGLAPLLGPHLRESAEEPAPKKRRMSLRSLLGWIVIPSFVLVFAMRARGAN